MAPFSSQQLSGRSVLLRVRETFDAAAAAELGELLADAPPDLAVTIDFGNVRDFLDFALVMLARDVIAARARVTLRGLGQHQRRVLRYFGMDEAALEGAPAPAARARS